GNWPFRVYIAFRPFCEAALTMTSRPKPLMLCILDGWGERSNGADNAIDKAKTPVWHELMRRWPHAQLNASEHYVGLPDGQMGNSEVGHTNIGAGRVVIQDLPRSDTPPQSAAGYLKQFQRDVAGHGAIRIATVIGRYYAMDRDKRWDRVAKAYAALTAAAGEHADDPVKAVEAAYARGETDEFVLPTALGDYRGIEDGDGVFFANFRADRIREIATALLDPDFPGFPRDKHIAFAAALGLVEYSTELNRFVATLFPPQDLSGTFGEIVSNAGMTQLRIAETEKYAHVTFFFNGGRETVFPGEERILVPSPKVATYDQQPEMSAPEVTDKVVAAVNSRRFDVVVLNYANTDMVGHTGDLAAAVKAVETVDHCLGRLAAAVEQQGGTLVITADHGNAEMMRDPKT